MKNNQTKNIAYGGLMAALAVVIMSIGGMIPVATYVCCVLCMILCETVRKICGKRICWAWFCAVSILGLLLGTDKEAASLFLFIGYYPILKPRFEKFKLGIILKFLFFNLMTVLLYCGMILVFGMTQHAVEFGEFGAIGLVFMLVLGNATFFLFDKMLTMFKKRR